MDGKTWEVSVTFSMPGCPEACFGVHKELGTPDWFLIKGQETIKIPARTAAAIVGLAIGYGEDEESDPETTHSLYALAEPIMGMLDEEQRLIP